MSTTDAGLGVCPSCGKPVAAVTETVESELLCAPRTRGREPGERWRRYEPCACQS